METFEEFFEQIRMFWASKKSNKALRTIKEKFCMFYCDAGIQVFSIDFVVKKGRLTSIQVTLEFETHLEEKDGRLGVDYSTDSYKF